MSSLCGWLHNYLIAEICILGLPNTGGVLIDPNGTCYAIGVILDGIATTKGDPARGSRYILQFVM
jgi:hypothetical protein